MSIKEQLKTSMPFKIAVGLCVVFVLIVVTFQILT